MTEIKQSKIPLDADHLQLKAEEKELPNNNKLDRRITCMWPSIPAQISQQLFQSWEGRPVVQRSPIGFKQKGFSDIWKVSWIINCILAPIFLRYLEVYEDADWTVGMRCKGQKINHRILSALKQNMWPWLQELDPATLCRPRNPCEFTNRDTKQDTREDNQSCIKQIGATSANKSKRVETKHHFIRKLKQESQYLSTEEMIAE